MGVPEKLAACAGRWSGPSTLTLDPTSGTFDTGTSTATLAPVAGGKFLRLDYDWHWKGERQDGLLLIGGDPAAEVTGHWVDGWHMGDLLMIARGSVTPGGGINLLGSFAAPPGPDWGWRLCLEPTADSELHFLMYVITPEGEEMVAVDIRYARS